MPGRTRASLPRYRQMSAVMTSRSMPSLGTKYSLVRLEPRALSRSRSLFAMAERRRFGSRKLEEGRREVLRPNVSHAQCSGPNYQPRGRKARNKKQRVRLERAVLVAGRCWRRARGRGEGRKAEDSSSVGDSVRGLFGSGLDWSHAALNEISRCGFPAAFTWE